MAIQKEINIVVKETGMDKVNQSIQQLETAVQDTEKATKSFKSQMREANEEARQMAQKFGATSKEAVQAAKKVADIKDQMEFTNDLVKRFNPDQKFKALGAATQLAGTGLQGVTSGMALFGDQSESTEKALLQVQSAMAFSDAISNLSDMGDQWQDLKTTIKDSTIAQKVYTASTGAAAMVQKLFTGGVATTTTGFKLLRGAIIATGIGALVVGIGLLISNFDKIKQVVLNFVPQLAKVGDTIMGIVNAVTDFIGVTSKAGRALDDQKALAEKALKQNELYLKKNEHKLSEARKREIELTNEHFQRLADGEMSKEESLKIFREKTNIDKQKSDDEANKKALEKQKEANEKRAEENKKANELAKQKAKEQSDAEIEILKEKFENEKTSFEEQRKLILADNKITAEDKARLIKEINKAEKDAVKQNAKDVEDLKNEYKRKIEDLDAETELQRIELEEKRALEELNKLKNNEEAKLELLKFYQQKKDDLATEKKKEEEEKAIEQKEIDAENQNLDFEERLNLLNEREKLITESTVLNQDEKNRLLLENEKSKADLDVEFEEKKNEAIGKSKENLQNIMSSLETLGINKSKAGQAISRAIALSQIGIDSAVAISKASTLANAEGVAAQLAFPTVPGAGTIARVLSYTTTALSVASNIARAKQLLSGGGSGGFSGGGTSGGSTPAPPPAPSFNLVQGTGRNQIAEGIQNQSPLKAYVVAKDVTTGQSMDRNIIEDARL